MKAFHGDPKIQEMYIARVKAHALADEIVQGQYWENGRGCAVGCTIHGDDHKKYETELGVPEELAYLQDTIFERLPLAEAKKFPLEFLQAIPLGADLTDIARLWKIRNLERLVEEQSSSNYSGKPQIIEAIRGVINFLYELPTLDEAAKSAAKSAEWSAEWSAWSARAESAEAAYFLWAKNQLLELLIHAEVA